MRYKLFGSSGLRVSELCLGTMTFGENGGVGASKEERLQIFERFAHWRASVASCICKVCATLIMLCSSTLEELAFVTGKCR
ncbi:MAG: hypothetical protein PUP93_31030 [Rhizonema sp. NSF051]|nr:hypothetical protein [Rhizonema sp. NSF051]